MRKFLSSVLAVVFAIALGSAPASANTMLWIQGASPVEIPLDEVMKRVPPGYTLQQINYPHGLWPWTGLFSATGAVSIAAGVTALDAAIRGAVAREGPTGNVLVVGESLGSMVVEQELRDLATQPKLDNLQFEVIADPSRPGGLVSYVPNGWLIPLTGTVAQPIAVTPYDVKVVRVQYDAIADFPDRPWHLLAVVNSLAGGVVYHGTDHYGVATQSIINGTFPAEDISAAINSRGGVTTTYTAKQSPALTHLFEPFLPQSVGLLNKVLTPIINRGYSALTPDAGPYLAPGGTLVTRKTARPARTAARGVPATADRRM